MNNKRIIEQEPISVAHFLLINTSDKRMAPELVDISFGHIRN